jgi:N-acetylglutamate synthase-like GNAT family acetyltransferase
MPIIDALYNHPEHLPTIAQWIVDTWGHFFPDFPYEKMQQELQKHLQKNQVPQTLIALDHNKLIGTVSLIEEDGIPSELTPWLASLYVLPEYRNQGIGGELIHAIIERAERMGFAKIYLLTFEPSLTIWYQKYGWILRGQDKVGEHPVDVMEYSVKGP